MARLWWNGERLGTTCNLTRMVSGKLTQPLISIAASPDQAHDPITSNSVCTAIVIKECKYYFVTSITIVLWQ